VRLHVRTLLLHTSMPPPTTSGLSTVGPRTLWNTRALWSMGASSIRDPIHCQDVMSIR